IWPEESFGDFDHAVNVAVAKLRAALCDSAETPRFVETLPRRGYRFILPVAFSTSTKPADTTTTVVTLPRPAAPSMKHRWATAAAVCLVVAGAAVAGLRLYLHQKHPLSDKDSVVLADFANSTGDSVFEGTLRQGLAVELEQSPFLSIVSDYRVQEALQL